MSEYTLRLMQPEDAINIISFMRGIADEPDNGTSFSSSDEVDWTESQVQERIQNQLEAENRLGLVAVDAAGNIIGTLNCDPSGVRGYMHTVSIGIAVRQDWRNHGVGTALMRNALDWCVSNKTIKRVELTVFTNNPRAIHVYEKLGFVREGVRRSAYYKHGEFLDLLHMGIVYERDI